MLESIQSQTVRAVLVTGSLDGAAKLMGITIMDVMRIITSVGLLAHNDMGYRPTYRAWTRDSDVIAHSMARRGWHPDAVAVFLNRYPDEVRARWPWPWPQKPAWEVRWEATRLVTPQRTRQLSLFDLAAASAGG